MWKTPELHYRGDLWNSTREQRETIARGIMAERGFEVRRVMNLASGLYMTAVLDDGSHVNIGDMEAGRFAWKRAEVAL
jgi:hypothetical protein